MQSPLRAGSPQRARSARGPTAAALACTILGALLVPAPGLAHGPCECLVPMLGTAPADVTIAGTRAYKVIFNPRPHAYGTAMRDAGYHSAYRPDAPSKAMIVRARTRPVRGVRFRVPEAPPGVYLVLIFDGTERGTHATWAYYHVLGRPPKPRPTVAASTGAPVPPRANADAHGTGSTVGVGLLGVAVAVVVIAGCALRRHSA